MTLNCLDLIAHLKNEEIFNFWAPFMSKSVYLPAAGPRLQHKMVFFPTSPQLHSLLVFESKGVNVMHNKC